MGERKSARENHGSDYSIHLKICERRLIIWQNILVDVPLRVLHPDAKEESLEGDGWRLITEDDMKEEINPKLAKLSEFIKE